MEDMLKSQPIISKHLAGGWVNWRVKQKSAPEGACLLDAWRARRYAIANRLFTYGKGFITVANCRN
jgi:hypothetical protein